jgi:hypothetical protein
MTLKNDLNVYNGNGKNLVLSWINSIFLMKTIKINGFQNPKN